MASINPGPEQDLMWNSGAFRFALRGIAAPKAKQDDVHSAIEVASAIQAGEFDRAVSYLTWILREGDISQLAHRVGVDYQNFEDLLQKITSNESLLPLTKEQRAVARMLHAVRVLGLDSEVHPSTRAIKLLARFEENFRVSAPDNPRRFEPVAAAASLLAAQGSECEHAQPTGVWMIEESTRLGIPAVLVTTNHTLGGDSVSLIAESLARKGILDGRIDSSDLWLGCNDPEARIFWESRKDVPEVWSKAFKRLAACELAQGDRILIADDCHSGTAHPGDPELIKKPVREAFAACERLSKYSLVWASDTYSGLKVLDAGGVAGVVSDLFMPWLTGSHSKSAGDSIVKDIMSPYIPSETVEHLLTVFREIEGRVGRVMREEFEKLITHL